jgi:hypothetical protein
MRIKWLVGTLAVAAPLFALAQGGGDEFRSDVPLVNRQNLWQPAAFDWGPPRWSDPVMRDPGPFGHDPRPVSTPIASGPSPTSAPEVGGESAAAGLALLLGGLTVLRTRRSSRSGLA